MPGFFVYTSLTVAGRRMRRCCEKTLEEQLDRRDDPQRLRVEATSAKTLRFTVHCVEFGHTTVIELSGGGNRPDRVHVEEAIGVS